jgi:hypothetical protein
MPPMAALEQLPRPRVITVSFWCWIAGSLLAGVTVALIATTVDAMHAEFARLARDRDPDASASTIDSVASASVLIVIGLGLLLTVLGVALAAGLRAARGWARGLLTVVALAAVGYTALVTSALTDPMLDDLRGPVVGGVLGYAVLVLAATVCMYLPGTKAWFRRPKSR